MNFNNLVVSIAITISGVLTILIGWSTNQNRITLEKQSTQIQAMQQRITELENREIQVNVNLSVNGEPMTETKQIPPSVKSTF